MRVFWIFTLSLGEWFPTCQGIVVPSSSRGEKFKKKTHSWKWPLT